MAGLKGWRAVTVATGRWLAPRFPELSRQLRKWLNGRLSDQQRADLAVADLLQAGRDYLGGKGELAQRGALQAQVAFSRSAMKSVDANVARGRDAMNRALLEKADQNRAMFRNGLGWVDFVWGDAKKGIAHILEQRQSQDGMSRKDAERLLTDRLVQTIASGTEAQRIESGGSVNLRLQHNGDMAILVKNPGSNSWLLTGFEIKPSGGTGTGFDASGPTRQAPTPTQRRTGADGERSLSQTARGGKIAPEPKVIKQLEARHGSAIRDTIGISADQLTGPESQYLYNFKSADELRGRAAKAGLERVGLLSAKNLLSERAAGVDSHAAPEEPRGNPDDVRFKRGDDEAAAQEKTAAEPSSPRAPGESHEAWQRRLALEGRPHMEAALRQEALAQRDIGRGMLRAMFAKREQTQERANAAFHDATRYFDKAGEKANLESIDQYETGGASTVKDPVARPYFVAMEKGFQWRAKRIQELEPTAKNTTKNCEFV